MKLPPWSLEMSLDFMDRHSIDAVIFSFGAPATSLAKDTVKAADMVRDINEYMAALRDARPTRVGFLASLPSLDDEAACLAELAYSLDVLKADGVQILTSYQERYLGDPTFRPIWAELNRREAVVLIHPTLEDSDGAIKDPWIPRPIFDWTHETTRTAVHLLLSNTVRDNKNCKIILSHGGGTLPYIANRSAHLSADLALSGKTAEEFLAEASSFYFDLAFASYELPLQLLKQFAQPGHIMYGSDYPFGRERTVQTQLEVLNAMDGAAEETISIKRGAAMRLFPRFKTTRMD